MGFKMKKIVSLIWIGIITIMLFVGCGVECSEGCGNNATYGCEEQRCDLCCKIAGYSDCNFNNHK